MQGEARSKEGTLQCTKHRSGRGKKFVFFGEIIRLKFAEFSRKYEKFNFFYQFIKNQSPLGGGGGVQLFETNQSHSLNFYSAISEIFFRPTNDGKNLSFSTFWRYFLWTEDQNITKKFARRRQEPHAKKIGNFGSWNLLHKKFEK